MQHKDSLTKISKGNLFKTINFVSKPKDEYLEQLEKYKRSNTYVKNLFDKRTIEN